MATAPILMGTFKQNRKEVEDNGPDSSISIEHSDSNDDLFYGNRRPPDPMNYTRENGRKTKEEQ